MADFLHGRDSFKLLQQLKQQPLPANSLSCNKAHKRSIIQQRHGADY